MRKARCPFCEGPGDLLLTARDRNRETTGADFEYARCETCATVFMVDPPGDLARYYAGNYHAFGPDGEPLWKGDEKLAAAERFRVELVLRHAGPGPLIEVGAGAGGFATAAKAAGFEITAIEMDEACCEYLSTGVGVRAIRSADPVEAIAPLPPARVVAMWHVLEHLPNPRAALEAAADKLEPGGVLAVAIPNARSVQFRLLRERWAHLDAPRHLTLIPPESLIGRGRELGLTPVEVTTADPSGVACNVLGWVYALRRRPVGVAPAIASLSGRAIATAMAPVERRGVRGAAVTVLMRKDA